MAAKPIKLKFNQRRLAGFSGNQLKLIAFLLMICDHVGCMLIENGVLYGQNPIYWDLALQTPEGQRWYLAARILRFLGRLSFPIFAFLTVEGFTHTRNVRNYLLRLALFAAISEVPFDLAIKGILWYPEYQNVLVTLVLAVLSMYFMEKSRKYPFLQALTIGFFCAAAWFLRSDYGPVGVLLISVLYLFRMDKNAQLISGAVISAAESYTYTGVAALSYLLLWFYNGKRGDWALKYLFYFAYPAHLLLFWALVYLANR